MYRRILCLPNSLRIIIMVSSFATHSASELVRSSVKKHYSQQEFYTSPPCLASQSAPLMNTCWPVLRTCNSNTFVLFFLSFLYSKKEFLQPKNHSSSNHVFKKIFSSYSEKEKKISANYILIFFTQSNKTEMFSQVQILRHFYKAPCEIKSVRCQISNFFANPYKLDPDFS